MRLQLKRIIGVLVLPALAAMLVAAAVGTPAAGAFVASEFKSASFPVTSLGEGLGASKFLSENLNSVTCQNSHGKGEVKGKADATGTITYLTGCELVVENSSIGKFKESCPTITTKELLIVPLSLLNLNSANAGVLVLPVTGTELANFTCTGSNKVNVKVLGSVICESTPTGKLSFEGEIVCKEGAKHGEQQFTDGKNPQGKLVESKLTAETTAFGIFKTTEKDAQITTENLKYSQELEQTLGG